MAPSTFTLSDVNPLRIVISVWVSPLCSDSAGAMGARGEDGILKATRFSGSTDVFEAGDVGASKPNCATGREAGIGARRAGIECVGINGTNPCRLLSVVEVRAKAIIYGACPAT
jgi:hypothetical protein